MTSQLEKYRGVNFLPQIPPIGTPGILKFKNGEKMKHPNAQAVKVVKIKCQ